MRWVYELDEAVRDLAWRTWPWVGFTAVITTVIWLGWYLTR